MVICSANVSAVFSPLVAYETSGLLIGETYSVDLFLRLFVALGIRFIHLKQDFQVSAIYFDLIHSLTVISVFY